MKSIRNLIRFFKDAYNELKHVTWLSKKEVIASTYVVIIVVIAMAIFVSAVDFILARILGVVL